MHEAHDGRCPQEGALLDALRLWAWDRGRTDVIGDLDLHDAAWGARETPTKDILANLAALLASRNIGSPTRADLHRLAVDRLAAADADSHGAVRPAGFERWCRDLCRRVDADLAEMETG